MNNRKQQVIQGTYDFTLMGIIFLLILTGWFMIFASEFNPDKFTSIFQLQKNYGRQLLFIGLSFLIVVVIQFMESRIIQNLSFYYLGFILILLVAVLFTKPINGSTSWFDLGWFRFQPSEFGKTATAMALAFLLSIPDIKMTQNSGRLQALGLISIPILLVLLQNDTGSTLVYLSFFLVLFRAGFPSVFFVLVLLGIILSIAALLVDSIWIILLSLLMIATLILLRNNKKLEKYFLTFFIVTLILWLFSQGAWVFIWIYVFFILFLILSIYEIVYKNWQLVITISVLLITMITYVGSVNYLVHNALQPHQQERIWVWLRPEKCDPLGSMYNLEQSKYAIGSGGIFGKGFLEGERTKLDYIPEQTTDFIFCTVGEEWGFIGNSLVILLFASFLLRVIYIAERQRTHFAKYYAYGVASIFLFHIFVNIGMTMGLLPVIGIPLPFISYGGSSMLSFSIMVGILIKLDSERNSAYRS